MSFMFAIRCRSKSRTKTNKTSLAWNGSMVCLAAVFGTGLGRRKMPFTRYL
ncbi:hypothetical protein HDZ31DRAFT_70350 [Schizophyllum fasciatum]